MTCKTCKWLNVEPDKAGRIVVRVDRGYRCTVELPPLVLPVSVTQAYGFHWPPARRSMGPADGEGCPFFAPREKT